MKKVIFIKLFLFTMIISSCFIFPKLPKISKDIYTKGVIVEEEDLKKLKEGKKEVNNIILGKLNVTWVKSGNPRPIRDEKAKIINNLKDYVEYSYIFSPIEAMGEIGLFPVSSIIIFETTVFGDNKYEVKELKLITTDKGTDLDFEGDYRKFIPKRESSEDKPNYVNAYNFGVINETLLKIFASGFDKNIQKWRYILANLKLLNKETNKNEEYKISLNSKLFEDTIKLIIQKYPNELLKNHLRPK